MVRTSLDGSDVIVLPAVLDQAASEGLLATLRAAVAAGKPVRLDASRVETLALSCIQAIIAATRAGQGVTIADPSAVFTDVFRGLGLDGGLAAAPAADADWFAAADDTPTVVVDDAPGLTQEAPAPSAAAASDDTAAPPPPAAPQPQAASDVPPPAKRVLTIDDSKTMRDMLRLTLSNSGFDVLQAVDGRDGLDVLEKESVDVVITDINMPKMDGYGVIAHLRGDPNYDSTPILVLTTESDKGKKDRARELGATGFIVKPFNPESLVEVILKVSP